MVMLDLMNWFSDQPLPQLIINLTDAVSLAPWYSTWAFILAVSNLCFPDVLKSLRIDGLHNVFKLIRIYIMYLIFSAFWNLILSYLDSNLPYYFIKPFAVRQLIGNCIFVLSIVLLCFSFHSTGLIFGIKNKDLPSEYAEFIVECSELGDGDGIDEVTYRNRKRSTTPDESHMEGRYPTRRPDLHYPKPGDENKALSYVNEKHDNKGLPNLSMTAGIKCNYKMDGSDLPEYYNGKKIKRAPTAAGRKKQVLKINIAEEERAKFINAREKERLDAYNKGMEIKGGIFPWLFGMKTNAEETY